MIHRGRIDVFCSIAECRSIKTLNHFLIWNYKKYIKKYEIVIDFFPKLSKGLKRYLQTTIL